MIDWVRALHWWGVVLYKLLMFAVLLNISANILVLNNNLKYIAEKLGEIHRAIHQREVDAE